MTEELIFTKLRRICDPALMRCKTTEELEALKDIIGPVRLQARVRLEREKGVMKG